MIKPFLRKKIPTLIALFILFIGAGVGVYLVGRDTNFLPRATPEQSPKQLQITNITDKSFTVVWVTDSPTTGFIKYGSSAVNLELTKTDDRDAVSGVAGEFATHHVTIRNLTPATDYYFKIGSGPSLSLYDNNGAPYVVTTGPSIADEAKVDTTYGTVVTPAQTPAENAVVILKIAGASTLSALVTQSGTWNIPLSTIRTQTLEEFYPYDPTSETISLEIIHPDGSLTSGTTTTDNDEPTPPITLGSSFDFTTLASLPDTTPPPTPDPEASNSASVSLNNPSKPGEQINSTKPEFQGKAPPQTELTITVHSPTTYSGQVTTDASGDFSWTPPADLEPGDHTITIAYLDENGQQQTFTRQFEVLAQGQSNLPSYTSSPSATPRPTPLPTPTPTPKATLTPSPSPTPKPTPSPTPIPRVSQPASGSAVPVAGDSSTTIFTLTAGVFLILSGWYFLKAS